MDIDREDVIVAKTAQRSPYGLTCLQCRASKVSARTSLSRRLRHKIAHVGSMRQDDTLRQMSATQHPMRPTTSALPAPFFKKKLPMPLAYNFVVPRVYQERRRRRRLAPMAMGNEGASLKQVAGGDLDDVVERMPVHAARRLCLAMSTTENIIFPGHETKHENSAISPHLSTDAAIVATQQNMLSHELPLSMQSRTVSAFCAKPELSSERSSSPSPEEMFYPSEYGPTRVKSMPQHDERSTFVNDSLKAHVMDDYNIATLFYDAQRQHQRQLILQHEFNRLQSEYAQQPIAEQSSMIQNAESLYETHDASKFLPHQGLPVPRYRGPYELLRWPTQHVADEPGYASEIQSLPMTGRQSSPWHYRISRRSMKERNHAVQAPTRASENRFAQVPIREEPVTSRRLPKLPLSCNDSSTVRQVTPNQCHSWQSSIERLLKHEDARKRALVHNYLLNIIELDDQAEAKVVHDDEHGFYHQQRIEKSGGSVKGADKSMHIKSDWKNTSERDLEQPLSRPTSANKVSAAESLVDLVNSEARKLLRTTRKRRLVRSVEDGDDLAVAAACASPTVPQPEVKQMTPLQMLNHATSLI